MKDTTKNCERCSYRQGYGPKEDMIFCAVCGRIRAIRNKDGKWENLY